jgi:hypothetical protein
VLVLKASELDRMPAHVVEALGTKVVV